MTDVTRGQPYRVFSTDFELSVRAKRVPGYRIFDMWGLNPDVDVGTEDIWANGGVRAVDPATGTVTLVSTSANDTSAGTGARTARLFGLDGSGNPQSESMSLNGTSNVTSVNSYSEIYALEILTVGSNGASVGNISATLDSSQLAFIAAGDGHSRLTQRTVRAGYRGYVLRMFASSSNAGAITVSIQTRNGAGTPWIAQRALDVDNRHVSLSPPGGICVVEPLTNIRMQAESTTNNERVMGGYTLLIEKIHDDEPSTLRSNDI